MSKYTVKVYIVQKADRQGNLYGPIIAAKLTHFEAHQIAKEYAPAKVTFVIADKTMHPNNPEYR